MSRRDTARRQQRQENLQRGLDHLEELTGVRLKESQLFTESRITSNARLKLGITESGDQVNLIRLPYPYLVAHFICGLLVSCGIVFLMVAGVEMAWIGGVLLLLSPISHGLIYWINSQAAQTNPVLSYDRSQRVLRITSRNCEVPRSDLCFIMALASARRSVQKQELNRSELKLIYQPDNIVKSKVITNTLYIQLEWYDAEIIPYAELLGIPYLHVTRSASQGMCEIEQVIP